MKVIFNSKLIRVTDNDLAVHLDYIFLSRIDFCEVRESSTSKEDKVIPVLILIDRLKIFCGQKSVIFGKNCSTICICKVVQLY